MDCGNAVFLKVIVQRLQERLRQFISRAFWAAWAARPSWRKKTLLFVFGMRCAIGSHLFFPNFRSALASIRASCAFDMRPAFTACEALALALRACDASGTGYERPGPAKSPFGRAFRARVVSFAILPNATKARATGRTDALRAQNYSNSSSLYLYLCYRTTMDGFGQQRTFAAAFPPTLRAWKAAAV